MKSILFVLALVFAFSAQAEILKRTTLSKSSGNKAYKQFLTLENGSQFQNALGKVISESRVKSTTEKEVVSSNGMNGIVSEKLTNCWFTAPSNYNCETVSQDRRWYVDPR